ncbi:hypothetical protein M2152_000135 [Microbacteriaceae bacterium SG_E_30_P1]|uniref:DUF4190 domain-containing protein n=1 Tax=Antiquaquibacter oligotrophicus TaxID=2880260 RepID=A0ABT6KJ61_9MICO|nr:DUF4190 domain-containing protein [Antiquaquibacter oligotrophicus]MDH6179953.1 hypothetical protein [Antiquaquibacter oligotrophicus]UDF14288.1 DUF4190 domain-containing protein [Antiquaquibacter oligotrophicus]
MTDTPTQTTESADPYASVSSQPSQTLSIVSMALGLSGFFLGIFVSIAAVVLGHLAQKREPQAKAFWLTGIIAGYVGIGFSLVVIVLSLVYVAFILLFVGIAATYN